MSFARTRLVMATDLRFHFRRPLFWMLMISLGLVAWGLSSGGLTIQSGDSTVGGQAQAWITSEFAVAQMFPLVSFLFYSFFVAVAAGMAIPRDDELEVGPVLHATPLKPKEYIWGKFAAVLLLFLVVLAGHLALTMFFNQVMPNARADLIRGPFELIHYLRPALFLALPFLVFLCGVSFAIGELTRKPILVFVAPTAFFLVSIFFLWDWSPAWLDPAINRLLMWIEPSGFRWMNETWLKIDLGVEHYNHQPVGYDPPFLTSRLVYLVAGLAMVVASARHFATTLRGAAQPAKPRWWRRRRQEAAAEKTGDATAELLRRPLASLGMTTRAPGFWRTVADVARFEARNLRSQPGLYIFVPLILLQTIGASFFQLGAFDTPLLLTPGVAAVGAMNTLTLLVCFLILFYNVESVSREGVTRLAPIYYATPARTAAVLSGKAVANSIVGVSILLACYLGAAVVMLIQGKVTPSVGPFLIVWGLLLVPTFLVWSCFVTAVYALTNNRFATYGLGLAAMAYTGWKQTQNEMNWVGNWNLWGATRWTDFGNLGLDPNGGALLLNRLFWLAVAAFLVALTVRVFPRREHDSGRTLDRLRPNQLLRTAWRLAPVALPAIVLGTVLGVEVSQGFQGKAVERREEEYRGRNLVTWAEAETPYITAVDVDLTLDPDARHFAVKGTYELENRSQKIQRRFPLSTGDHFEHKTWTLDGEPFAPEDWARMAVFELPEPLQPGGRLTVGFAYDGEYPHGITKNGGGIGQFILSSGVVLTSFESNFLPVLGFERGRGVDKDNRLQPRDYEEGYWEGKTRPALGGGSRFQVRTTIHGPARFRYHGVGVLESDEVVDGQRTMVWNTDHPVNFFNVVAAEWKEWKGDGVAVYYHDGHGYNIEEIGKALEASRRYYSEWFYPYPWQELKISEFPGLAGYAQGFPTNITFSEHIGFLTRSQPGERVAFMVTAHETAHQWWGNILLPGEGPGSDVLVEGMAHFSTLLLYEAVHGVGERIDFCKLIEDRYGDRRRVDSEKPLAWTDGSRDGDTTVVYDKGGWVPWMLLNLMGRDAMLEGVQDFIRRYAASDDYPVVQDFLAVMREHAPDPDAFDAFAKQWYLGVVMPQYKIDSAAKRQVDGGGWVVDAAVRNAGTGVMPVEIAAVRGTRFPERDDTGAETWQESRSTVVLGAGESATVQLTSDFEPTRVVVDPDALVLQLKRDQAEKKL